MRAALLGVSMMAACTDAGAVAASTSSGVDPSGSSSDGPMREPAPGDTSTATRDPDEVPTLARSDRYDAQADAELVLDAASGVLANDEAQAVIDYDARTQAGGTLQLESDGALRYRPPAHWAGCDRASYRVGDRAAAEIVWSVHGRGALRANTPLTAVAEHDEGLALVGEAAGQRLGGAIAGVGDMNGDGHPELAIAAADADVGDRIGAGTVHIVMDAGARGSIDPASLQDAGASFTVWGDRTGAHVGEQLAPAGDVDGDGLADLLVGAPRTNLGTGPQGDHVGRVFVVFGRVAPSDIDLAELLAPTPTSPGQAFTGEYMGDYAGTGIAAAGDLDGDGLDDLVIGAPLWGPLEARPGRVYVVFSSPDPGAWRFDQMLASGHAIALQGTGDAQLGRVVAGVGDLDGDGDRDLAIGAPGDASQPGRVWIVEGPVTGGVLDDLVADGRVHALEGDAAGDGFGTAIAAMGDLDGDGLDDLAIGAPGRDDARGRVWVVGGGTASLGGVATIADDVLTIDGPRERIAAGTVLAPAGDVDGDGHRDLWVGAGMADGGAGRAYAVRLSASIALGHQSASLVGHASMGTGRAIAGGFDLDDDAIPDAVIGSPGADDHGGYSGRADVVPGRAVVCD